MDGLQRDTVEGGFGYPLQGKAFPLVDSLQIGLQIVRNLEGHWDWPVDADHLQGVGDREDAAPRQQGVAGVGDQHEPIEPAPLLVDPIVIG
eukprot:9334056-Alexandrium_andersonii.AAC.1